MKVECKEVERKVYGWGRWKMSILHLNDPEYCEYGCPVCTRARNGIPGAFVPGAGHAVASMGSALIDRFPN